MSAICEKCLSEIPARTVERSDGVFLEKECPTHGYSEYLIEPNVDFWRMAHIKAEGDEAVLWDNTFLTTGLDVTRRCNVRCPACYAEPDNNEVDPSIEELVALAKTVKKSPSIILMGAEPTMRTDLPELIAAIKNATGKEIALYTNGIRLADERYAKRIFNAGVQSVCLSLNTQDYLDDPKLYDMKLKGLGQIIDAGVQINHVSYTLRTLEDLGAALADGQKLIGFTHHIRIRSPQSIGTCTNEPLFLSELYNTAVSLFRMAGLDPVILRSDNNGYHVMISAGGMAYRLIRFPSIETADLDELNTRPYAIFDKESGEINLVHSILLQTAKRHALEKKIRWAKE